MTVHAHIETLKKKHEILDRELASANASPSVDDATITGIKRRKLRVKDQINRLENSSFH